MPHSQVGKAMVFGTVMRWFESSWGKINEADICLSQASAFFVSTGLDQNMKSDENEQH